MKIQAIVRVKGNPPVTVVLPIKRAGWHLYSWSLAERIRKAARVPASVGWSSSIKVL